MCSNRLHHKRCSLITHTHTQLFNGLLSGTTRVGRYQKKHSPTHTHPDHQTSFINYLHLLRSIASSLFSLRADSPLWQPLSRSSLGFLLVLDPLLHTPCISLPNHHLFAAHVHTNAACSAAISRLCHLHLPKSVFTIRYDTRCYFNVRSKANMSQLNLPHGTKKNRQLKSVKTEKKLKAENRFAQK